MKNKNIKIKDINFKHHNNYTSHSLRYYKDEDLSIVEGINCKTNKFTYEIFFFNSKIDKVKNLLTKFEYEIGQITSLNEKNMLTIINKIKGEK
jgi:hypothetical protein